MGTILVVILIAGTLAIFTDWLFMGVLFHDAYNRYPEVWWTSGGSERKAIIWSSVIGYLMTAGVVGLCALADAQSLTQCLAIAALAWLAGPVVVLVVNGFFIKIDPKVTVAHCLGWLARMALAATFFLAFTPWTCC
jgi:hypothetical protein